MKILMGAVLGFLILPVQTYAMEQVPQSHDKDAFVHPTLVCSSGRHLRRNSWPRTASDTCTQTAYHTIHAACASKALQTCLKQAGLKIVENNKVDEEE